MYSLNVIREAAVEALDDSEDDNPDALAAFHRIADPRTVLELLELAETSPASDEMKQLIRDLATYVEKVADVSSAAKPLEQKELIARFHRLLDIAGH
jgi:predicted HAD superfamily Cof-like phosphohydrolase